VVRNRHVLFLFRLIAGGVFVWSGLLKAVHPLDFAQSVANYRLFPPWLSLAAGLALPWVEVVAGALLAAGLLRRAAALVVSGLLGFFIILVAVTMLRGLDLSCGCFGSLSGRVGWALLLQDAALLYLALSVFLSPGSFLSLDSALPGFRRP
jgi:putative oxidoreductase